MAATITRSSDAQSTPPAEFLSTPAKPSPSPPNTAPRLGMPFDRRLLLTTTLSFLSGFTLGSISTGHMASLRFRAENAHRLPISQPGWYLYHKSKNYYKWRYGVVEGLRKGSYVAAWTSVFFIVEESLDVFRGTWSAGRTMAEMEGVDELDIKRIDRGVDRSRDFLSSAMAGMVTGGLWSAWHQFPISTAARTIRLGLLVGLGYGLGQDGLALARERWGDGGAEGESWIYKGARNRQVADEVSRSLGKE
ncbi:Nn.00g011970.m01.CDS01 [Neocucurbitaria sp. VM-36]